MDTAISFTHPAGVGDSHLQLAPDPDLKGPLDRRSVSPSARPPRLNFAEHCLLCFGFRCESAFCIEHYEQSRWEICGYCDGSGFDAFAEQICNCAGGVVDMTDSEWPNRPRHRPPRLNLAGYCQWCMRRWCNNQRCIDRHLASEWMVCNRCEGTASDELSHTPCGCESGLVEAGHR